MGVRVGRFPLAYDPPSRRAVPATTTPAPTTGVPASLTTMPEKTLVGPVALSRTIVRAVSPSPAGIATSF